MTQTPETCQSPDSISSKAGTEEAQAVNVDRPEQADLNKTSSAVLAEAIVIANSSFPDKFWMFAKGRTRPSEPLYGFCVFEPDDPDNAITEAEHENPVECVRRAAREWKGR